MGFLNAIGALFFANNEDAQTGEAPNDKGQPPEAEHRGTVLAIDDDPALLLTLRAILSSAGFNVLTSTSGPKGLDLLRYARNVRVVLLDYNMPSFDGCITLEYIRKIAPSTRIIGLTGADTNMIAGRFASGVDKLISKPFRNQDLLDSIDLYLVKPEADVTDPVDPTRN